MVFLGLVWGFLVVGGVALQGYDYEDELRNKYTAALQTIRGDRWLDDTDAESEIMLGSDGSESSLGR